MSNLSRDNNPYLSPQFNEEIAATSARTLFIERCLWGSAVFGAIVAGARTHFWEIDQAGDIPRTANNLTFGALVGLGLVISVWVLL